MLLYFSLKFTKEQFNLSKYRVLPLSDTHNGLILPGYWWTGALLRWTESSNVGVESLGVGGVSRSRWCLQQCRHDILEKTRRFYRKFWTPVSQTWVMLLTWVLFIWPGYYNWGKSIPGLINRFSFWGPSLSLPCWHSDETNVQLRPDLISFGLTTIKRLIFNTSNSLVIFSVFNSSCHFISKQIFWDQNDEFNTANICSNILRRQAYE